MRKLLSAILILAIVFCFSACKKENNTSEASSEIAQSTSSMQTVVSTQTESSSSTPSTTSSVSSSSTPSKKTETTSEVEVQKVVYPEKVLAVYSYQNQFKMPQTEKKTFYDSVNGVTLPYRLFIPHDYSPNKKYPVILFLHGKGEIGIDNEDQLTGISKLFKNNGDLAASAFVICPQSYEWWNFDTDRGGTLSSAVRLVDEVISTYSCDSNRIYVTGLSMGGYATWDLLEAYGYKFAAGIPVCGIGNANNAAALKNIPIRIYHGTSDPTIHYSFSQEMYTAIKSAGGQKVELFLLEGVNHNAWDPTYSDRDAISWLLAQNKQTNPTCEYEVMPYLRITDSSGNTVISDDDIHALSYINDYETTGVYSIDFILSESGKNKLNRAYKASKGSAFTFYCGTQKIYTFTATSEIPDNVFSIRGIFDKINYQTFFDMIEQIVYN